MTSQTRSSGNARDDESRPLLDLPIDGGGLRSGSHGRALAGPATLTLVAAGLERAAFYSLQSNIVFFLLHTYPCLDPSTASFSSVLFLTCTYLLCFLVGLASDLFVPPYWAIVVGYVPYVTGYAFLTWTGFCPSSLLPRAGPNCSIEWCPGPGNYTIVNSVYVRPAVSSAIADATCSLYQIEKWKLWLAFAGVVLGASIQRTLVAPFGADQVKNRGLSATRGYFWQYYWSLNAGSLVSNIGMSFLQMNCGYGTGLLVPLGLLLLSWLIFATGYKCYRRRSPNRPAIKYFITIIRSALRLWRNRPRNSRDFGLYDLRFLDYAKVVNGGAHSIVAVENVKATTRVAFVLAVIFPYFCIYAKTMSAFADEGPHLAATSESEQQYKVPVSLLVAFNNIGLLVTIPLCNLVVYPLLCRWGVRLTMNKRITLGIFVITLSLLTAGGVEFIRQGAGTTEYQWIGDTKYYNVSNLTVFAQTPQYALLGASEAFTFVSVIEFTYVLSPGCLQGIMMGILWMYVGASQVVNMLLVKMPYGYDSAAWAPIAFYFSAAALSGCLTFAFALCGMKCDAGLNTLTVPEPPRPAARQHPVDLGGSSSPLTSSDSPPSDSLQQ